MPFYGMWEVDSFSVVSAEPPTVAGFQSASLAAEPPALFTPKLEKEYRVGPGVDQWVGLNFNSPNRMTILLKDGVTDGVDVSRKPDPITGRTQVTDSDDPAWKASLTFVPSGKDLLSIQGTVNGVPIAAKFHRRDISKFPLAQEKFQFIQDEPGN